ncbi:ketopantoate reductase PanE/ApbA C terminal-domain-containing protein [Amylocarpus encephaloides]|uniref:Ketopantoate reductase PanE/ApbA C terminal-domain-containing protein n=1 Tax=Amylocarpus encephaloides TaxID=45428 RepID=A0A9P7Y8S2_9HELO|nr:ketopantoate reductase PanE/ApbA C terminal-domain-containing protein [Amylocarpus encephaloides]
MKGGDGIILPHERHLRRGYSWQATQGAIADPHQDIPFIDGFPERLIREGLPGRLKRESIRKWEFPVPPILFEEINRRPTSPAPLSVEPTVEDVKTKEEITESQSIDENVETDRGRTLQPAPKLNHPALETTDKKEPVDISIGSWTNTEQKKAVTIEAKTSPTVEAHLLSRKRSRTIHVLGSGPVSKYIAHSLAKQPYSAQVALLPHSPHLMKMWQSEGAAIKVISRGKINIQSGFLVEPSWDYSYTRGTTNRGSHPLGVIDNMIVATDLSATIPALMAVRNRIRPSSAICFMQDTLGIIDEVNSKIFPDPVRRPNYVMANITHKIQATGMNFTIIEREIGFVSFTAIPQSVRIQEQQKKLQQVDSYPLIRRMDAQWGPLRHITRSLARVPELHTESLRRPDFIKRQLERMIVSSVIGPLTVMFDCSNDQLLYNYHVSQALKLLLEEIIHIIRHLPELSQLPRKQQLLNTHPLHSMVISAIKKTGTNVSPMLQAVRKGRRTGIEFYNGYFVRRARELGLPCSQNEMMISLVEGKKRVIDQEKSAYIPICNQYSGA